MNAPEEVQAQEVATQDQAQVQPAEDQAATAAEIAPKAAKAVKSKKEPKAPKEPVVKDEKNGVVRPKAGTTTAKVWEIADSISQAQGKPAPRKDVLDQAKAAGVNESTAATQHGRWRKYHGLKSADES